MEKQVAEGTRYRDCFKGVDGRRTEIVCMTWISQTMSGTALGSLSAFFFQQAGISASDSFKRKYQLKKKPSYYPPSLVLL